MATYSKKVLMDAIRDQCYECNDLRQGWDDPEKDCTGKSCPLYPVRPGNGPGHIEKGVTKKYHGKGYGSKSIQEPISEHQHDAELALESHEPPKKVAAGRRKYQRKSA